MRLNIIAPSMCIRAQEATELNCRWRKTRLSRLGLPLTRFRIDPSNFLIHPALHIINDGLFWIIQMLKYLWTKARIIRICKIYPLPGPKQKKKKIKFEIFFFHILSQEGAYFLRGFKFRILLVSVKQTNITHGPIFLF